MERVNSSNESITDLYAQLTDNEPKPISEYVPANAKEQQEAFMKGEIRNPDHEYARLNAIDFASRYAAIDTIGNQIINSPDLDTKYVPVYDEFIKGYAKKTRLMELAHDYKHTDNPEERAIIKGEYMQLNIELYGEPDETTYRSLLHEKLTKIAKKDLHGSAVKLRDELFAMVNFDEGAEYPARFRPSPDTVTWMKDVAETLYENMLAHIPDQEKFNPTEVKAVFDAILQQEFDGAADEWSVDIEAAESINVKSAEKRVVIPVDKGEISYKEMREKVVHEIGVHAFRAITGAQSDLDPLKNGLNDYYDSEEGLGKVREHAINGKFGEAGIEPYITAGAAYFDGMDFRDVVEMKWRLSVLASAGADVEIPADKIESAKKVAYKSAMRSMRGTDELPWFKDLAYYNGSADMWRHLETIRGDDLKFMFVLMGKANPANALHERILLETKEAA
jgi:hypothetical protein